MQRPGGGFALGCVLLSTLVTAAPAGATHAAPWMPPRGGGAVGAPTPPRDPGGWCATDPNRPQDGTASDPTC